MTEELAALDLEEKLKWLQDETEQMEEIGESWDRLDPYTESNFEIIQVANTVEEEEKEKDLPGPSMPARGKRKRRRGGRLTLRKKKRAKVECVPEKEKEEKVCLCFLCNNISNYCNCLYRECLRMSLNDNSKILEKKTIKMEMMKTNKNKNRKALWTHDTKKDDGDDGGTGGSGGVGGIATGKTVATEGRGSHFGGDGSKGGSSGVDGGGKFTGTG